MRKILEVNVDRVEKRRIPSKHYVYVMHVTWSDGGPYRIYRRYSRLFDLQSALLDKFPIEAGSVDPSARIMPFLPGKIIFGRSHIRDVAERRLDPIDEYCKKLIKLHHKISQCDEVLEFFEVEPDDLDPPSEEKGQDGVKKAEKISKPKTFKQYIAVADYEKQDRGEIDMYRGMVVEVVEKKETGWWFVNSEDAQGWVPSTYLEPADGKKDTKITVRAPPGQEEKYICCEKFEAGGDDEIGLEKGAIVDVLEKNMEGWWLVRYQGREGYAPATFLIKTEEERNSLAHRKSTEVEIIQNLADISNIMKNKDESEEAKEEKLSTDYQSSMYRKVQHRSYSLEHSIKPPPRQNSKNGSSTVNVAVPNSSVKKSHYVTIAEFEDTVGDGISFQEGQSVEVKEKNESGWWFVSIEGKEGWVPASYIESQANKENVDDEEGSVYTTIEDSAEAFSDWSAEDDDEFGECYEESGVKYRKKNKRKKLTDSLMNQFRKRKSSKEMDTKCSDSPDCNHSNNSHVLPPLPPQKPSRLEGVISKQNGFSALKESSQGLVNIIKSKLDRPTSKSVDESRKFVTPTAPVKPVPPQKTPVSEMKPVLPSKLLKPEKEISKPNGVQVIALSTNKPLVPASKPILPEKPAVKPKPAAPPKPSIPTKPSVPTKPSIPAKPSSLKPVVPQKPGLPMKQPSLCKPKTSAGPPKLPAKVLPSRKPEDNDNNNNKKHDSQPVNGTAVSGLAAALQSKFENKSGHPPKLPSKPAMPKQAQDHNEKESKEKAGSDVNKPNVSNLVNALSNKLNFGSDRPLVFQSGSSDKDSADIGHSNNHIGNGRMDVKKDLLSNDIKNGRMDVKNDLLSKDIFVALSDFYGETDEELDMCAGDEVQVLEATDGGWWMVQLNRKTGWVPSAYLSRKQEPQCPPVPPHANYSAKTIEERVMKTVYQTSAFFTAECEGELGFEEGVIVDEVKDQSDSDWWFIRIGLDEGWAPSSFLHQIEIEDKRKSFSGSKPVPPKIKPAFGK